MLQEKLAPADIGPSISTVFLPHWQMIVVVTSYFVRRQHPCLGGYTDIVGHIKGGYMHCQTKMHAPTAMGLLSARSWHLNYLFVRLCFPQVGLEYASELVRRSPQRLVGDMGVTLCGCGLSMPEQLTHHLE